MADKREPTRAEINGELVKRGFDKTASGKNYANGRAITRKGGGQ